MLCLKKNGRQVATLQAGKEKKAKMLTGFLKAAYGLAISWEELGVSNKKQFFSRVYTRRSSDAGAGRGELLLVAQAGRRQEA